MCPCALRRISTWRSSLKLKCLRYLQKLSFKIIFLCYFSDIVINNTFQLNNDIEAFSRRKSMLIDVNFQFNDGNSHFLNLEHIPSLSNSDNISIELRAFKISNKNSNLEIEFDHECFKNSNKTSDFSLDGLDYKRTYFLFGNPFTGYFDNVFTIKNTTLINKEYYHGQTRDNLLNLPIFKFPRLKKLIFNSVYFVRNKLNLGPNRLEICKLNCHWVHIYNAKGADYDLFIDGQKCDQNYTNLMTHSFKCFYFEENKIKSKHRFFKYHQI